jgi:hypothetical protein
MMIPPLGVDLHAAASVWRRFAAAAALIDGNILILIST